LIIILNEILNYIRESLPKYRNSLKDKAPRQRHCFYQLLIFRIYDKIFKLHGAEEEDILNSVITKCESSKGANQESLRLFNEI